MGKLSGMIVGAALMVSMGTASAGEAPEAVGAANAGQTSEIVGAANVAEAPEILGVADYQAMTKSEMSNVNGELALGSVVGLVNSILARLGLGPLPSLPLPI